MAAPKGHKKWGGRQKGTPNKRSQQAMDLLSSLDADGLEEMVRIARAEVPCLECGGTGRAKYTIGPMGPYRDEDNGIEATCQMCHGTKRHPVGIDLRASMWKEIAQYIHPKRKAIEHSTPPGDAFVVEFK